MKLFVRLNKTTLLQKKKEIFRGELFDELQLCFVLDYTTIRFHEEINNFKIFYY